MRRGAGLLLRPPHARAAVRRAAQIRAACRHPHGTVRHQRGIGSFPAESVAPRFGGFPMKPRFKSDRYLQVAFMAAAAILVLVIALYYRSLAVSRDSETWVQHSHQVSGELQDMLYAMTNIDASARAYLTTGAEPFLDSWRTGLTNLKQHMAAVRTLTIDNPAQQARLPQLDVLIAQRTQFYERMNTLSRADGRSAAAEAVRT